MIKPTHREKIGMRRQKRRVREDDELACMFMKNFNERYDPAYHHMTKVLPFRA